MEPIYKYGMLFAGEPVPESERLRVMEELSQTGQLTFELERSVEGWSAQCNEIPAIIAGNTNPNPSDIEIQSELRSAIFAAFNVQVEKPDVTSPYFQQDIFRYSVS